LGVVFTSTISHAQTSSLTATITDSDTQTWNNGSWTATLVNPVPQIPPSINGTPLTSAQQHLSGSMSSSGVITGTFSDNNYIVPAGTTWQFTICPNASVACSTGSTTVTGVSPNLSATLSAFVTAPRFPASSNAYGYRDAEVSPTPLPGGTYYNTGSLAVWRQWNGSAWTSVGGGGGGGTIAHTLLGLAGDNSGNAILETPQVMANTLIDSTGTSMYESSINPVVTGSVQDNVVMGVDAGSNLAPGAANMGGQANVIFGHDAALHATSMRESVVVGDKACSAITGNGTGADDMINVCIGSLAAANVVNQGGAFVAIGQKAALNATGLFGTVLLGIHAGTALISDGTSGSPPNDGHSVIIGASALNLNSGIVSNHNTIVGGDAATNTATNSVISNEACMGDQCLQNLDGTTGHGLYNTCVGSQCGKGVTTGDENLLLGYQVGSCSGTITGSQNFLAVNTAGCNLSSGSGNMMYGSAAGYSVSSGSENLLLGRRAGANITTGNYNVFLGSFAGDGIGNVNYDIGIGVGAGDRSQVDGRISIGRYAGVLSTTGTGNTFIGQFASGNSSATAGITTGSNDTCIGDSSCPTPTNESNLTAIGEGADSAVGVHDAVELGPGQNTITNTIAAHGKSFFDFNTGYSLEKANLPSVLFSAAGTALPTCNSGTKGLTAVVTDATVPTYLGTYTSGGAVVAPVACNGSAWVTY